MRRIFVLLLLGLYACTGESVTIRGSLHPDVADDPDRVWVVDGPAAVPVQDGTFEISGIQPGPVQLRIGDDDTDPARLVVLDLPAGASLSLRRIRLDDGELAFPSSIRLAGADLVTVNGIRMADPDALPARVSERGVVLAVGSEGEALLFRPRGDALPDLRVLITPLTLVDSRGGEREIEDLSPGAAVRISGPVEEGYLRAERIEILPEVEEEEEPREERGAGPTREVRSPPAVDAVEERVEIRERVEVREDGEREEKRERKERKKEEKRRDRAEIPKGHKPPPGKCRDWIPGLPPGQQPPPRDC